MWKVTTKAGGGQGDKRETVPQEPKGRKQSCPMETKRTASSWDKVKLSEKKKAGRKTGLDNGLPGQTKTWEKVH